jgi:hypothetical protein
MAPLIGHFLFINCCLVGSSDKEDKTEFKWPYPNISSLSSQCCGRFPRDHRLAAVINRFEDRYADIDASEGSDECRDENDVENFEEIASLAECVMQIPTLRVSLC